MIQKLKASEYLKRYDNMTVGEREAFCRRVGEWMQTYGRTLSQKADEPEAQLQNVAQAALAWNDVEQQAWTEGVRLLSAFGAKMESGWWPEGIYNKSAKRAIRVLIRTLAPAGVQVQGEAAGLTQSVLIRQELMQGGDAITEQQTKKGTTGKPAGTVAATPATKQQGTVTRGSGKISEMAQQRGGWMGNVYPAPPIKPIAKADQMTVHPGIKDGTFGNAPELSIVKGRPAIPVRPTHFDQYVHLLSQAAQELAEEYGPTKREMDESRQKLALLLDDPHASANDRQTWATHITKLDNKLKRITDRVDAEWAELVKQGRVVVDDLGMAHVVDVADAGGVDGIAENAKKDDAEKQAAKEKRDKIKALRCWIRDCRTAPKNQKHLTHWRKKYLEMIALGGLDTVTDAVREAAKFYSFDLDALNKEAGLEEVKSEE